MSLIMGLKRMKLTLLTRGEEKKAWAGGSTLFYSYHYNWRSKRIRLPSKKKKTHTSKEKIHATATPQWAGAQWYYAENNYFRLCIDLQSPSRSRCTQGYNIVKVCNARKRF